MWYFHVWPRLLELKPRFFQEVRAMVHELKLVNHCAHVQQQQCSLCAIRSAWNWKKKKNSSHFTEHLPSEVLICPAGRTGRCPYSWVRATRGCPVYPARKRTQVIQLASPPGAITVISYESDPQTYLNLIIMNTICWQWFHQRQIPREDNTFIKNESWFVCFLSGSSLKSEQRQTGMSQWDCS